MIDLTRLNGHAIVVNCDLIKFVEATPDTTLTLANGERLIIRETCAQLVELVVLWRTRILRSAWPESYGPFASTITQGAICLPTPVIEDE